MGRTKRDSGNWLMTYSDLVTLLLVFFVLLYMLTPGIDDSTFDNFISYFQQSIGVMEQTSVLESQSGSRVEIRARIMEQWQAVEEYLEQEGITTQVEIAETDDGLKITLSDELTFESGSSELLPEAQRVLAQVAAMLNHEVMESEVQGHTDDMPVSQHSLYRSNWHLGAGRAVSVVQFLQDRSDFHPERFRATSFGEYRPVAENESQEGRRQNRRVEIYIRYLALSESQDEPLPAESVEQIQIR